MEKTSCLRCVKFIHSISNSPITIYIVKKIKTPKMFVAFDTSHSLYTQRFILFLKHLPGIASPEENKKALCHIAWNPLNPWIICTKFGWNWINDSETEDFYKLPSVYISSVAIISPWKMKCPFVWTCWIYNSQRWLEKIS